MLFASCLVSESQFSTIDTATVTYTPLTNSATITIPGICTNANYTTINLTYKIIGDTLPVAFGKVNYNFSQIGALAGFVPIYSGGASNLYVTNRMTLIGSLVANYPPETIVVSGCGANLNGVFYNSSTNHWPSIYETWTNTIGVGISIYISGGATNYVVCCDGPDSAATTNNVLLIPTYGQSYPGSWYGGGGGNPLFTFYIYPTNHLAALTVSTNNELLVNGNPVGNGGNFIPTFNGFGTNTTIGYAVTNILYNNITLSGGTNTALNGTYVLDYDTNYITPREYYSQFWWTNSANTNIYISMGFSGETNFQGHVVNFPGSPYGYPLYILKNGTGIGYEALPFVYYSWNAPVGKWTQWGYDRSPLAGAGGSGIQTVVNNNPVFNGNRFTPAIFQWQLQVPSNDANSSYSAQHGLGHTPSRVDWFFYCYATDAAHGYDVGDKIQIDASTINANACNTTKFANSTTVEMDLTGSLQLGSISHIIDRTTPYTYFSLDVTLAGDGNTASTNYLIEADVWP